MSIVTGQSMIGEYWQTRKKAILEGKIWPYEGKLRKLISPDVRPGAMMNGGTQTANIGDPEHWVKGLDEPIKESSSLAKFLAQMTKICQIDREKLETIKADILPMMQKTLDQLKAECFIFKDSSVDLVGSAPENSKIGEPDEFDFAIKLPEFAKPENGYGWKPGRAYEWLMQNQNSSDDENLEDIYSFEEDSLHVRIKELFQNEMKNHLPRNYKMIETKCHKTVQIAGTVHLIRENDKFLVDLDLCFWIPYNRQDLLMASPKDFPQRDNIMAHTSEESPVVNIILPNDVTMAVSPFRFATSYEERAMLKATDPDNPYLICYRLTKAIGKFLLPKIIKTERSCHICMDSTIASFFFKQTLLNMIQHYRLDSDWNQTQLGNRLIEIFCILNTSLELNSGHVMTLFSVEEKRIDGFEAKEKKDCLIFPKSVEKLLTIFRNKQAEDSVKDYFEYLHKCEWDTASLIRSIITLLLRLKDLKE